MGCWIPCPFWKPNWSFENNSDFSKNIYIYIQLYDAFSTILENADSTEIYTIVILRSHNHKENVQPICQEKIWKFFEYLLKLLLYLIRFSNLSSRFLMLQICLTGYFEIPLNWKFMIGSIFYSLISLNKWPRNKEKIPLRQGWI